MQESNLKYASAKNFYCVKRKVISEQVVEFLLNQYVKGRINEDKVYETINKIIETNIENRKKNKYRSVKNKI